MHATLRLLLTCAASATLAGLSGCSLAPADLRLVHRAEASGEASLREFLQQALEDPGSTESSHALGHFVEQWHRHRSAAEEGVLEAPDGDGTRYSVRFVTCCGSSYRPGYFDSIRPTADFRVSRLEHHVRPGIGAPLVAIRENRGREKIEPFYPPEAITRPLTAVIDPDPERNGTREVRIRLLCPLSHDQVELAGRSAPLAADFTVPWAALLSMTGRLRASPVTSLLGTTEARDPRLYLMQPYDPAKEPLIMIHGLLSTPLAWAELSNELWADEEIRRRYQIWHFLYNTSAPALYASRMLRTQLRELRPLLDPTGREPAMQATTLLAHSMGGIVAKGMVVRPADAFWDVAFTRPFDDLKLSPADRSELQEAFFWQPAKHIRRVIFVAVPHRGSPFADNPIGRFGVRLTRPPSQFQAFYQRISQANPGAFTPAYEQLGSGELDSVHSLSPSQPTLSILAGLKPSPRVKLHSIIGDRGRRGPVEDSSDGIVPYWSSHLDGVESELIVPAGHGAFRHPEAVAEIRRILTLPEGRRKSAPKCRGQRRN